MVKKRTRDEEFEHLKRIEAFQIRMGQESGIEPAICRFCGEPIYWLHARRGKHAGPSFCRQSLRLHIFRLEQEKEQEG